MQLLCSFVRLLGNVSLERLSQVSRSSSSLTSQHVVVEDRRIHVVKAGSGARAVLLLPGALGSALSDFRPQLEGLDREKVGGLGDHLSYSDSAAHSDRLGPSWVRPVQ